MAKGFQSIVSIEHVSHTKALDPFTITTNHEYYTKIYQKMKLHIEHSHVPPGRLEKVEGQKQVCMCYNSRPSPAMATISQSTLTGTIESIFKVQRISNPNIYVDMQQASRPDEKQDPRE